LADLAISVTVCLASGRSLAFKIAAVSAAAVFLLGDAAGHVRQMVAVGNVVPGNAGVPFYMDVICPVLAIALLTVAHRRLLGVAAVPALADREAKHDRPASG
jgi:hypothetical protein